MSEPVFRGIGQDPTIDRPVYTFDRSPIGSLRD